MIMAAVIRGSSIFDYRVPSGQSKQWPAKQTKLGEILQKDGMRWNLHAKDEPSQEESFRLKMKDDDNINGYFRSK